MPLLFLEECLQLECKAKLLPHPKEPCCRALTVYICTAQELKQNTTCLRVLTQTGFNPNSPQDSCQQATKIKIVFRR